MNEEQIKAENVLHEVDHFDLTVFVFGRSRLRAKAREVVIVIGDERLCVSKGVRILYDDGAIFVAMRIGERGCVCFEVICVCEREGVWIWIVVFGIVLYRN